MHVEEDLKLAVLGCVGAGGRKRVEVTRTTITPVVGPDGEWEALDRETCVIKETDEMLGARRRVNGVPAMVSSWADAKVKTGDFESYGIGVSISIPVNASPREIEDAKLDVIREVRQTIKAERIKIKADPWERVAAVKSGLVKLEELPPAIAEAIKAHL